MKSLHQTPCWHLNDLCDAGNRHACNVYDQKKCGDRKEMFTNRTKPASRAMNTMYIVIAIALVIIGAIVFIYYFSTNRNIRRSNSDVVDIDEESQYTLSLSSDISPSSIRYAVPEKTTTGYYSEI